MSYPNTYPHSPLCNEMVKRGNEKALLLQFILSQLLRCAEQYTQNHSLDFVFSTPACFFPFDWSYEVGCLNKVNEHVKLLAYAFQDQEEAIDDFETILHAIIDEVTERKKTGEELPHPELISVIKELYNKLTPFLIACKENENLVLFLLAHKRQIETLSNQGALKNLLNQMHPGRNYEQLRSCFEQRGFQNQLRQFDELITEYA